MNDPDQSARIKPVAYQAPDASALRGPIKSRAMLASFAALGLIILVAVLFFIFSRSVRFEITPPAQSIEVQGGVGFAAGNGYLLLPGEYRVRLAAEGYEVLESRFAVSDAREQTFKYELTRLPGKLTIISNPSADVFLDDNPRGKTPLDQIQVATGKHRLLLRAPRYQAHEAEIDIEGGGIEQTIKIELQPGWAPVSVSSTPEGAQILVDGQPVDRTPATLELGAGRHDLQLKKEGYAPWRDSIKVVAKEPLTLPRVSLSPAMGTLRLSSTPNGASVTVAGKFAGQTPLALRLKPAVSHTLKISAPGHRPATRSVELLSEKTDSLNVQLEAILGQVALDVEPSDAQVSINGEPLAAGTRQLELPATAHRVTASKPGYAPYSGTVTPRAGLEQIVTIRLRSDAEIKAARMPARLSSKGGPQLVLVDGGKFTMGTRRGEQGRQSNEAQRPVLLTRPYYLGVREVSNAEFRKFDNKHSSGIMRRKTLDNERQPAARVSWDAAARYCNWLSAQDGLPPAYVDKGGAMDIIVPITTGYRLPSEAEWEFAARFAGRSNPDKFPWGSGFPPKAKDGNYADQNAEMFTPKVLHGLDDGYSASSPVGHYRPNAIGLYDMGGNVSEWVHDWYTAAIAINPKETSDPFGPTSGSERIVRGSSWLHGSIVQLRLAYRDYASEPRPDLGFRVARYAE